MPDLTGTRAPLTAFAASHPGLQRENNEDRCHADVERGIFFVIDGVGGQAAGDRAAEIAQAMLLARLERETGSPAERVREAIALANNEIYRAARGDPRWSGMACVLTVALVRDGRVTIGHVGDSRLYKLRAGAIRKVTSDHSPVGDREDRGELSESEAMRHPRRNEIYRDVGSEAHEPDDQEFIDVLEADFEPDSALLLCTDGLSDLVPSSQIAAIVAANAGDPPVVVEALLQAANDAGGKDNVSAVYVQGERFGVGPQESESRASGPSPSTGLRAGKRGPDGHGVVASVIGSRWVALAGGGVLGVALVLAALAWTQRVPVRVRDLLPAGSWPRTWVVNQDGTGDFSSIRDALDRARAGDTVRVDPGEYRERVILAGGVALVSSVPHGAVILPPPGGDGAGAVGVELQAGPARLSGFRIAGDAQGVLAVGVRLRRSDGEVDGVDVSGARVSAVAIEGTSHPTLRASYIHDNPGVGIVVGPRANPSLLNNVVTGNGRQPDALKPGVALHENARPVLFGNIVMNNGIDAVAGATPAQHEEFTRDNIIGRPAPPAAARPTPKKK